MKAGKTAIFTILTLVPFLYTAAAGHPEKADPAADPSRTFAAISAINPGTVFTDPTKNTISGPATFATVTPAFLLSDDPAASAGKHQAAAKKTKAALPSPKAKKMKKEECEAAVAAAKAKDPAGKEPVIDGCDESKDEEPKLSEEARKELDEFYRAQDEAPGEAATDEDYNAKEPADTGAWGQDLETGSIGGGDGKVTLYNKWTGEKLEDFRYKGQDNKYAAGAEEKLKNFMRDRRNGQRAGIPLKLIEILDIVQDRLGGKKITVVSAYRSPSTNKSVGGVKRSLHMKGWAADISMEGVNPQVLSKKAKDLKAGGVGTYPNFVHVDIGSVRYW